MHSGEKKYKIVMRDISCLEVETEKNRVLSPETKSKHPMNRGDNHKAGMLGNQLATDLPKGVRKSFCGCGVAAKSKLDERGDRVPAFILHVHFCANPRGL